MSAHYTWEASLPFSWNPVAGKLEESEKTVSDLFASR